MIYPKQVEEAILADDTLRTRFGHALYPGEVNVGQRPLNNDPFLDIWLRTIGWRQKDEVRRYFDFIKEMKEIFNSVRANMCYANPSSCHLGGDDKWVAGWAGVGMMPIALYLYYLHSHGIRGAVLECGCFKGGSSVCLSWVCHRLGLKLYVADSFEGLPESDDSFYNKGSFAGTLDEVRSNIASFGKIENVEFIKGFFSESLKGFNEDLMLLWMDVDLRISVLDAMEHAYPNLVKDGVIFSDGLGEDRDFSGDRLQPASGESQGLIEYFQKHGINHKARYAGYGHLGLVVPNCPDTGIVLYEPHKESIFTAIADVEGLGLAISEQRHRIDALMGSA